MYFMRICHEPQLEKLYYTLMFERVWKHSSNHAVICSLWIAELKQRWISASVPPGAEFGARTRGARRAQPSRLC